MDRHSGQLEELAVEGILAFAERILPACVRPVGPGLIRPAPAVQRLFSPNGIAFDGNRFMRTAATAPAFSLPEIETGNEGLVDQNGVSWNPLLTWLRQIDGIRQGI